MRFLALYDRFTKRIVFADQTRLSASVNFAWAAVYGQFRFVFDRRSLNVQREGI